MEVEEFLIQMKNFFEKMNELKRDLKQQICEREKARNDLLHELELANLDAVEIMKLAKTLKSVLLERRKFKDELERVEILINFTEKYNSKCITGDIIKVLNRLKEKQDELNNRKYYARRITNLKCAEDTYANNNTLNGKTEEKQSANIHK